jgi:hypothetical protein
MPKLNIPPEYEIGLIKILILPEEALRSLHSVLKDAPPILNPKKRASSLFGKVDGIDEADVEPIISTLYSLYVAQANLGLSANDFVSDLMAALEESLVKQGSATPEKREQATRRLIDLLSIPRLKAEAKAVEVLHEYEHALSRVRILTDIRPVFDDNPEGKPSGVVLVHTLKITYLESRELKNFFVALDESDIKMLKNALDRAEKKGATLKSLFSSEEVPFFESE